MRWRAEVDSTGDAAVVRLHGDLDLLVQQRLRELLTDAVAGHRHLLLDLADVRLIDSAGLRVLMRAHQHAKRKDGILCLVAPSRFVLTVLHTMRLHPVFPIFPNTGQALTWLAAQAAPRSPATGEAGDRGALGRA